jgi:uncharacterized protein (TIGR02452 family)
MNNTMDNNIFNHIDWLHQFKIASEQKLGFRELRAKIFQDTIKRVQAGAYSIDEISIHIQNDNVIESAEYFEKPDSLPTGTNYDTKFAVINADCLETAYLLLQSALNPCVLNLASRQNPGGGVLNGAGAQEENIFRRSNLFLSLYQFAPYANEYGIRKNQKQYPLNRNSGGIYSANITVFRGSEKHGYCLLKKPFKISVVSVAAINHPTTVQKNNLFYLTDDMIEPTKEKIRTILRIAWKYNHDSLVLGAFGCGAFGNPPNHVAELFKAVFSEFEFINKFKVVVFAILEDHNSHKTHNPNGNVLPFLQTFDNNVNSIK